jgi:mono/diheme cytochrome c family protein
VPAKYEKMKNPFLNATDTENIGRILYAQHCKSCHGSKGKGDGKKAASIDTPIGDFTDDSFKNQTDGALYYKTYFGRDDMPSFDKKITAEEDKWLVINYIKNL